MKGNELLKTGKCVDLYGIPFSYILINGIFTFNESYIDLKLQNVLLLVKFSCKHNKTNW